MDDPSNMPANSGMDGEVALVAAASQGTVQRDRPVGASPRQLHLLRAAYPSDRQRDEVFDVQRLASLVRGASQRELVPVKGSTPDPNGPRMSDIDRARSALHAIDSGCSRDEWVKIAMAARAAGLSFNDFHSWSEAAHNYRSEADCRNVWKSISDVGGIQVGTLFARAREAGWRPPTNGHAFQWQEKPQERHQQNGEVKAPSFDFGRVWNDSKAAADDHPYIVRKLGLSAGLRVYRGDLKLNGQALDVALLVPAFDAEGKLQTWQAIPPDGDKRNAPGASVRGASFTIGGEPRDGERLYLCEGVSQAWSAHQATGKPAVVCFGAGNVETITLQMHERFPRARIVVVCDAGKEVDGERIARAVGGAWVEMPEGSPANYDLNDYHRQVRDLDAVAELLERTHEPETQTGDEWPGDGAIVEYLRTPAPAVAWYARERLLAGRGHLLTGIGGSSKTRTLYHLAFGAVLGRLPWDWQIDRIGSALLILCEDTADTVHRTIAAMRSAMQLSADEIAALADRLRVHGLAGKPSHLLLAAPGGVLAESFRVDALIAEIRRLPKPVTFVGLDPAIGLTEGDEMTSAHQRRLGELVDRIAIETGTCVVLSTHSAKSLQSADEIGSHTSRGSGAITDAVRGEFALRTMTAAEARQFGVTDIAERKAFVQLVGVKGNELPPEAFAPVWLRRGSGGVLSPVTLEVRPEAALGKREMGALDLLRNLASTGAPTLKTWRDACTDAGLLTGPTDRAREKAMERIRDALLAAGLIERGVGRGVFVPAKVEEAA